MNLRGIALAFPIAEFLLAATLCAQDAGGFLFRAPRATLTLRAGFDLRRTSGSFYDFVTSELTLNRRDFNAASVAGDLGYTLAGPVDLVLSVAHARRSVVSEFRDWVDQDGLPITQRTTLYTTPVTAAARVYLTSRGRQIGRFVWIPARFQPYLGAGAGVVRYSLQQSGSFIDSQDSSIFDDQLHSEGWAPLGLVMAGVDYTVIPRVGLNADVRYLHGKGNLRRDFIDFTDGIDLSGFQFSLGLQFRL